MALASANTFSGSLVRTPSGGEALPRVCGRRKPIIGHFCSQCFSICGFSLHSGHEGSSAGSSKWAYDLSSGVCPNRRWARGTVSARLEETMQSAFQVKCWTVMVRRMRAFAVATEMGRGGVPVAAAFVLLYSFHESAGHSLIFRSLEDVISLILPITLKWL